VTAGRRGPARLAAVAGVGGAAWITAAVVVAGLAEPGYRHRSQFVSELGARGAAHGELFSFAGFLPAGILLLAFAVLAARSVPAGALSVLGFGGLAFYAAGYVVAAVFRCDPGCDLADPSASQVVHAVIGGLGYPVGAVSVILLGVAALRWPGVVAWHAALGIAAGLAALVATLFVVPGFAWLGVAQRIVEGCVLGWILACSIYLARASGRDRVPAA